MLGVDEDLERMRFGNDTVAFQIILNRREFENILLVSKSVEANCQRDTGRINRFTCKERINSILRRHT